MILCGAGSIEETCTVGTICTFNGQVRMILCGAKIVYSSRFLTPGPPKTPSGSDANSPNDAGNGMQVAVVQCLTMLLPSIAISPPGRSGK